MYREFLRLGLIEVLDPDLCKRLETGEEVSYELDNSLRNEIAKIGDLLLEYCSISVINQALWHLGEVIVLKKVEFA